MSGQCSHHTSHSHQHETHVGRLSLTLALVIIYCFAEVVGGLWTGSLALLADAGHMASDAAALVISLFAAWIIGRRPTQQQTFGYYRAEILAALANGAILFIVAGGILHEAWERFYSPHPILGGPMFWIAVGGLVINLISLKVLHGGHDENLNLRGAWLHVMGDTLGSVAVIIAAILIWQFGWIWADPVASVLACILILFSAWHLIKDAADILMEHAPRDIDVLQVRNEILSLPNVVDVHCLHIWTISSGLRAISAHVVTSTSESQKDDLQRLQSLLHHSFQLRHITLQLEDAQTAVCEQARLGDCLMTIQNDHSH